MKKINILICLLTILCLCFAFAACDLFGTNSGSKEFLLYGFEGEYEISAGEAFAQTELIIPDNAYKIANDGFANRTTIESLSTSKAVEIGARAFENCTSISIVSIGSTLERYSSDAFDGCNSLTEIVVDEQNPYFKSVDGVLYSKDESILLKYPANRVGTNYTVPHGTIVDGHAFRGCRNLISIEISENVRLGDGVFEDCLNLSEVKITGNILIGDEQQQVNRDFYLFTNAGKNNGLNIIFGKDVTTVPDYLCHGSNYIDSSGQIIQEYGGTYIKSIAFEQGSGCVEIGSYAFMGCSRLESVTVPNEMPLEKIRRNAFSYTAIDSFPFEACNGLKYIDAWAFCDSNLQTITIPQSLTEIGPGAFSNCDSLTKVSYNATVCDITDKSTLSEPVFHHSDSENEFNLTIGSNVTYLPAKIFLSSNVASVKFEDNCLLKKLNPETFKDCTKLSHVDFGQNCHVQIIDSRVFSGCDSLKSITIPRSVIYITPTAFSSPLEQAFFDIANGWRGKLGTTEYPVPSLTNPENAAQYLIKGFTYDKYRRYCEFWYLGNLEEILEILKSFD